MKFRRKPVVVEAHRIGDDGWPDSIWQGVNDNQIYSSGGAGITLDTVNYFEANDNIIEGCARAAIKVLDSTWGGVEDNTIFWTPGFNRRFY